MTTYTVAKPVTILRDDLILDALPQKVLKKLGKREDTGFHLSLGRRDIFCTNGTVRYVLGADKVTVEMD